MEIIAFLVLLFVLALLRAAGSRSRGEGSSSSGGGRYTVIGGSGNTFNITENHTHTNTVHIHKGGRSAPLFMVTFDGGKGNQYRVPVIANNSAQVDAQLGEIRKIAKGNGARAGKNVLIERVPPEALDTADMDPVMLTDGRSR